MALTLDLAGRPPSNCRGTADFMGTVSWTRMVIAAPRVAFECGTAFTNVTMSLDRQQ